MENGPETFANPVEEYVVTFFSDTSDESDVIRADLEAGGIRFTELDYGDDPEIPTPYLSVLSPPRFMDATYFGSANILGDFIPAFQEGTRLLIKQIEASAHLFI